MAEWCRQPTVSTPCLWASISSLRDSCFIWILFIGMQWRTKDFPGGGEEHQLLNIRHKRIIWQDFCRKLPDFQMTEIGPGAGVPSPPPGSSANGMFKVPFYNSRFLCQKCSSVIVIETD